MPVPNPAVARIRKAPAALKTPPVGSPLWKRWGSEVLRLKIAELKAHLGEGKDDLQVAEEMALSTGEYNELKSAMYEWETTDLHDKAAEEVYIDYTLRQKQCIKDLDGMIAEFRRTKQFNAMVGAVRAKSDIIDKLIAKGQEFGILEKAPEKKQIVAGIMVAELSNEQLRSVITKELLGLDALAKRYGEVDMSTAPLLLAEPSKLPAVIPSSGGSAPGRPSFATGGAAKAAGGHATAVARSKAKAPPA